MEIKIDKNKCIGCGTCAAICSNSFKMSNEDGKAEVIENTTDDFDTIKSAVDTCPVGAIEVKK